MNVKLATLGLLALMTGPAGAQRNPPPMTLDDAIQIARQRNPAFRPWSPTEARPTAENPRPAQARIGYFVSSFKPAPGFTSRPPS